MLWHQIQQHLISLLPFGTLFAKHKETPPPPPSLSSPLPPRPCSELYDLVLDLDWNRVMAHCQQSPQDAQFQEGDGLETPLYLACQWNPPLPVIQALIQANPQALLLTSREHRDLPLHMISRYASTTAQVLQEFLCQYPATARQATKYGKTALWILWDHARPDVMKQQQSTNIDTSSSTTTTACSRPWTREQQEQVDSFWDKIDLLVDALATSRQEPWPARDTTCSISSCSSGDNCDTTNRRDKKGSDAITTACSLSLIHI